MTKEPTRPAMHMVFTNNSKPYVRKRGIEQALQEQWTSTTVS
jgi:hypothetical protein